MKVNWKSIERIRWTDEEDKFLLDQIGKHSKETHMGLARRILDHPFVAGRSLDAVEQRIGWLRAKLKK